jgi:hypothetical protein
LTKEVVVQRIESTRHESFRAQIQEHLDSWIANCREMETKVDFEYNKRRPITVEDYLEGSPIQPLVPKDRESKDREGSLKA